jgi:hypothetical protein
LRFFDGGLRGWEKRNRWSKKSKLPEAFKYRNAYHSRMKPRRFDRRPGFILLELLVVTMNPAITWCTLPT